MEEKKDGGNKSQIIGEHESDKCDYIDLIKMDYKICNDGYNSRDQMANALFYKLVHIFLIYFTIILAINIFVEINLMVHVACCSLLGIAGLISMLSLLISLESVSSCKVALREHCTEIEKMGEFLNHLRYWDVIKGRTKFRIEEKVKDFESESKEPEGFYYVLTSKLLIFIWILIVIIVIIYGHKIRFALLVS